MKSKKRIPLITISHYGALYGANRSLLTLILASKEFINWLVICKTEGDFTRELAKNNIRFKIIPFAVDIHSGSLDGVRKTIKALLKFVINLAVIPYILLLAFKHHALAIHSNSSVFTLGAIVAYIGKIPHLWHIREFPELHYDSFYDFGQNWFRFWANKSTRIICVSAYLQKLRITKNNIDADTIVLYNGIDSDEASSSKILLAPFQLVMVGLIHPSKDQLTAIRAVEILIKAGIKIHLKIVGGIGGRFGEDPYYKSLKDYIKTNNLDRHIELTGYKSDVDEIYRGAHLSLVCSRSEGMGRVTVESMLRGIPVIAYKEGGSTEIVVHNEDGVLYTGDHKALAAEIKALLLNPQKFQKLSYQASVNAKTKFNVGLYKDKFLDLIATIQANES